MAQIKNKFIGDLQVTAPKIGSLSATAVQPLFADGSGNAAFRSILSTDIPTLNQNTTGTASNITATSNATLTTLSALTTAGSLAISGSQVSGGTFGAVNGSALTNLSAAALSGVLPVGVTGGSGLSIATSQLTGTIDLTSQVSGILPYANGGTDASSQADAQINMSPMTTAGDLTYENATPAPDRLPIGTTGQVLTVVGGLPTWAATGVTGLTTNHIFVGSAGGVATDVAMSGEASIVASGAVTLSNAAVIAKVLTGYTSGAGTITSADSILSAIEKLNGNDALYLPLAGGTMSGSINGGGFEAFNFATPTASSSLSTKGYVDAAIAGLTWKGPVQAYSTSNVPLTGSTPLVIDGYTVLDGDLLLLAAQTTSADDGEYSTAITGGSYVLTPNGLPDAIGDAWLVLNGTVYTDSAFVATSPVPTATFVEFAGPTAYTFNAPLSLSGRTVSITQSSTSVDGYLSAADFTTFNNKQPAGNYITALTGDATASGPGSAALTLATVNSNVGSFGSSTSIPSFTVNAKGLITAASGNVVIAPAGTLSGTTLNATVVSSSLTSVGTITSGTWTGTTIAITNGGTGQTSASAAFAALSPLTTAGDIIYENATPAPARLPIGSTGQVLTVVGGVPAWAPTVGTLTVTEENITLVSGDITNQFIDLAHAVQGSSASVNSISLNVVGGPEQLKVIDYTVSLTGGSGGVTRITFAGDLATGGNAALVAGDILQVKYAY